MNVTKMGEHANNARMLTPKDCLESCLKSLGQKMPQGNIKKVLVIALDDTEDNYGVYCNQAGMKEHECVALCEAAKAIFLEELGFFE